MSRRKAQLPMERYFLDEAWRWSAGKPERKLLPWKAVPPLVDLQHSEWSKRFEKLCRNRLVMGAFRYGLIREQDYHKYDIVGDIIRRAERFRTTKNLECLVDIANMAMLGFVQGERDGLRMAAVDDGEHTQEVGSYNV